MEVVVPPADDGEVGPISPDPAGPTHPSRPARLLVLTAVLALVVAGCVVALVVVLATRTGDGSFGDRVRSVVEGSDGADVQSQREAAMAQAQQFVLRVNTYGPGDLDNKNTLPTYAERVSEVITAKFDADFEKVGLPLAETTVAQSGYSRSATVFSAGVSDIDVDKATVLVAGSFTGSYPDPEDAERRIEVEPLPFRYEISMVKTDGTWLVDDFIPAGSDGDNVGAPPGIDPSVPPVDEQPAPSGAPGQGGTTP